MNQLGTVKFFNIEKGFGFISLDNGGNDAFVHISDVERSGFTTLRQNQRLSFDLGNDKHERLSAINLATVD